MDLKYNSEAVEWCCMSSESRQKLDLLKQVQNTISGGALLPAKERLSQAIRVLRNLKLAIEERGAPYGADSVSKVS